MQVIETEKLDKARLPPHERYFLELWYSMTHMQSLDSYRVRCMNSRTIVRELSDELRIGLIDDSELIGLCEEALAILSGDPIVEAHFALNLKVIQPFLATPPVKEAKDKKDKDSVDTRKKGREFLFASEDFTVALEREYFDHLCDALPPAVRPDNEDEILILTGSILSDLMDQGWTLEALYRWHKHFVSGGKSAKYSFAQNLAFMLKQLKRGAQAFVVTLRLSGSDKLASIEKYGEFTIAPNAPMTPATEAEQSFCSRNRYVSFATRNVEAVDAFSAAIHARNSFEQLLDLLRFDFERSVVKIDEIYFVQRQGDNKTYLPRIVHSVPNPIETDEEADFLNFVRDFDDVTARPAVDTSSQWQLQAAIRQYRFGRDSEGYKDKFLNWWMGLEALAHVGRGKGIGPEVQHNVSRAMIKDYLLRTVRDLLVTLKYCRVDWSEDLARQSGCANLKEVSVGQLLRVLQSKSHQEQLWEKCKDHPLLVYRGGKISEWLRDPKMIAAQLELHRQHLEWHLNRLYRIRCCIVHGSPIHFRLGLFAANLEYYLKQLILFVLAAFRDNEHLTHLDELFRRASISYDRLVAGLKEETAGVDEAREAVFADIVVKGSPSQQVAPNRR